MLGAFVGRLHVVLVHFPIALILAAALFESLALVRRERIPSELARSLVALGALGARAGRRARTERADGAGPFRAALALAALGVGVTGHIGGNMVHGEDFLFGPLFEASPEATPGPAVAGPSSGRAPDGATAATATAGFDYAGRVEPLFARHCLECHGPNKQKGRLRLDRRTDVLDRPAEDAIVIPGDPDGSELLRRVMLPPLDPDAMPAKGDPLSAEEQATLREWIARGAPWPDAP